MLDEDDEDDAGSDLSSAYGEPDPEADLPDPESDLPSVPSVDVPTPPRPTDDVPAELQRAFWTTVVLFNVALAATSVGAMMLAFGVERPLGAGLLVLGLFSLARGYLKYRRLAERQRAGALGEGGEQSAADERDG